METKLLTTQDVADYFGVHKNVVTQKFCKEGLKFIRLSQTDFRYNKKDIIEFEEKMKVSADDIEKYVEDIKTISTSKRCTLKI